MAQQTAYKRSLSGSIGAGMQSVMGTNGRRYYVLEHKISSQYHKAGESQKIIVDQIELGRDASCQVCFDESFTTVSRHHAAIVRDGDNWKLVQLSQTNSTYLNGRKVAKEWYLQSGDEIQLSTNGPKLGFIVPAGDKSLVKSIGLTARLNLFGQQALRPYKTAIASLVVLLLLACAGGGYALYDANQQRGALEDLLVLNQREAAAQDSIIHAQTAQLKAQQQELEKKVKAAATQASKGRRVPASTSALKQADKYVYFVYTSHYEVSFNGQSQTLKCDNEQAPFHSGTGFLLSDGRFVTARHVIEPWAYWSSGDGVDEFQMGLNTIVNNGGSVRLYMRAISSVGDEITLCSSNMFVNRSSDQYDYYEGYKISLASSSAKDYAYTNTSKSKGLAFDARLSKNLERGDHLDVLGFPLGIGANSPSDIHPTYGSAMVALDGLDRGGIVTTDTNYEHGNSGGPVFTTNDKGSLVVVGIVSAGAGRNTGFITPISAIY